MFASLKLLKRGKKIITLIAVITVSFVMWNYFHGKKGTSTDVVKADRGVTLALVSDLSLNSSPLPLLGTVTSRSEASIRAESSGKLVRVYKKLGDYVGAGEVIAEFDNSGERASVLSAQGAYDAAKAGQGIAEISSGSASQSLEEAKIQTVNTIATAYTILDDAVRTKTDTAFKNPQSSNPLLTVNMSDSRLLISLPQQRVTIEELLKSREVRNRTLSTKDDLLAELDTLEGGAQTVKNYLDDLSLGFSRAIPDTSASQATVDGYKASTAIARASINGLLSAISGARTTLKASMTANSIAEKNFSGNSMSKNATTDANLKIALGSLNAAQSRLEKTIVRSPIGGTINSLPVETGDFVSPFADIAVVSNNSALEVIAYATEDDAKVLSVGGKVVMNDSVEGVVTRIAPALDPKTKKIEVRIGIVRNANTLINGQSVRINAARQKQRSTQVSQLQIPLSALKITPTGSIVFTVSTSSTLVGHPVKEGALLGEQIVISEGLTLEMLIVTDARGLRDGQAVSITK